MSNTIVVYKGPNQNYLYPAGTWLTHLDLKNMHPVRVSRTNGKIMDMIKSWATRQIVSDADVKKIIGPTTHVINTICRMFNVFHNGKGVGLVAANDCTVGREAEELCQMCSESASGALAGVVIDPKLITWTDQNAAKYRHMM